MITHYRVTNNSYSVFPGSTFVAITGNNNNGNKYIAHALERGAQTIIVQAGTLTEEIRLLCIQYGASVIESNNPRKEMALRASEAYNHPAKKLSIIGVTGTKGKTTTTYLIRHILQHYGLKTALIGTISNSILDKQTPSNLTTPNSDYLHAFFDECLAHKINVVVMELSAHAFVQYRTENISFKSFGFTNLMPDHLDYFKTMENYFYAKRSFFNQLTSDGIGFAFDDTWGILITKYLKEINHKYISLSETDAYEKALPTTNLIGDFNKKNIYLATEMCQKFGIPRNKISEALASFPGIPGRLQQCRLTNGALGIVDFAHNGPATEVVLASLRPMTHHLIVIFGCGGDRDPSRRKGMGKAAAHYADVIIITNDNPRTEDPHHIIAEILTGIDNIDKKNLYIIPDRQAAIKKGVEISHSGSIITVLGKGHEKKQIIGNQITLCDDLATLSSF